MKKSLIRIFLLFVSNGLTSPLNIVFSILLVEEMGAESFGKVAFYSSILLLVGNIVQETFQSYTLAGPRRTRIVEQFASPKSFRIFVAATIAMFSAWMFLLPQEFFFLNFSFALVLIGVCNFFVGVIWGELRNLGDFLVPNLINKIAMPAVNILGFFALKSLGVADVASVIDLLALSNLVAVLGLASYQSPVVDRDHWRPDVRLFSFMKGGLVEISLPQITIIIPGVFLPAEQVGSIRLAMQMGNMCLLPGASLYYIFVPELVQKIRDNLISTYRYARNRIRFFAAASVFLLVIAVIAVKPIVASVFKGIDVPQVFDYFLIISFGNFAAAAMGPSNQVYSLTGHAEENFRILLAVALALIFSSVALFLVDGQVWLFLFLVALANFSSKYMAHIALNRYFVRQD